MGHIVIWIHGAESGTLSNDTMLYDTDLGNPIVMWIFHKQASAPSHQPRSTQGEGSNGLLYGQKPWDKSISSYLKVETLYKFGWPTKLECFKTYNLNPKLEKGAKRAIQKRTQIHSTQPCGNQRTQNLQSHLIHITTSYSKNEINILKIIE